jgi:hypothetical protein
MTTGDIAAVLEKSKQSVSNALGKMKEKGKVIYPGYGQWTIPKEVTPLTSLTPVTSPIKSGVTTDESETGGSYTAPIDKNVSVSSVSDVTKPPSGADVYTSPEQQALWETEGELEIW